MEFNNEAKVYECVRKEYEGKSYFTLMIQGENIPFSKINSNKPFSVGDIVNVGFRRRESDMKLIPTVL